MSLRVVLSRSLALVCLALCSCADPYPRPEGRVEILEAREDIGENSSGTIVAYRVVCSGRLAVERWGVTLRLDTKPAAEGAKQRRYWASLTVESRLPPAASSTGELLISYDEASERLVEGSAVVEAFWFE